MVFPRVICQEAVGEEGDILGPFPQGGQLYLEYIETVQQILAELARPDERIQVQIGREIGRASCRERVCQYV